MVLQAHLIAVVGVLLIGSAVLLVGGVSGVQAETSQEKKQGHTEATKQEQGHSGGAATEGGNRCDRTRTIVRLGAGYLTNDLSGCPNKGGLLSAQLLDTGRNKISDPKYGLLRGEKGDDEIRGGSELYGGDGDDVIYGGSGHDWIVGNNGDDVIHAGDDSDVFLSGGKGDDVIYGGDGNDFMGDAHGEDVLYGGDGNDHLDALQPGLQPKDGGLDKLYCGEGWDKYVADPIDYVSGSCEEDELADTGGPPLVLLAAAALLLGSGILTYAPLRRR